MTGSEADPDDWSDFQAEWRAKHLADAEFCHHKDGHPTFAEDPYSEDGYCCWCGNGSWKLHAPWCEWADHRDAERSEPSEGPSKGAQ